MKISVAILVAAAVMGGVLATSAAGQARAYVGRSLADVLGVISRERSGERWTSHAGEALVLARGSAPTRQTIATSGREWGWVNQLAPPFTLEGSTLGGFLTWVERHHGLRRQYADASLSDRVEDIVLHGSIRRFDAGRGVVGGTADVRYDVPTSGRPGHHSRPLTTNH